MTRKLLAVPLVVMMLVACSGMSNTQQKMLSGGAIGAAAGAGITAIAGGNPIWGAIGGAAVGTAGGYLMSK
jgi:hypothetical protein